MRPVCLLVLMGCASLAVTAPASAGERVPALARMRLDDPRSPTLYVRYQDRKLRIAYSFEGLRTAKHLRLVRTRTWYEAHNHIYYRDREYAEVKLTGPIGSFTAVRMQPCVSVLLADDRGKPVPPEDDFEFIPTFHFLYRDGSGVTWDYVVSSEAALVRTNLLAKTDLVEMTVPDPKQLTLDLQTWDGPGSISLSVEAKLGRELLGHLYRNGRICPMRVTIVNARGRLMQSAAGDIRRFAAHMGRDGLTEFYNARVPKGVYTVTATIGRTSFSKPVTASQKVEVR